MLHSDLIGRVMEDRGVVVRDIIRGSIRTTVSDISSPYVGGQGIRTKIGGYILTKLGFRIKIK